MSIATELTYYNDGLLDAYTAVNTKGGTVPANKNLDNLEAAITSIPSGGGGDVVNSVVDQFMASTTDIAANTFVEFVDSTTITTASAGSTASGTTISFCSVAIDANTVLVFGGPTGPLTARLCTISNGQITVGSTVQLIASGNGTSLYVNAFLVDTNTVLVLHQGTSNGTLSGQVVTIQNGAITAGTETAVSSYNLSASSYAAEKIDTNKVIVMYRASSDYYVGAVLTVANGEFTIGTPKTINSTQDTGVFNGESLTRIDATHILATYRSATDATKLVSVICSISDSTITVGEEVLNQIDYTIGSSMSLSTPISSNKILVVLKGGTPQNGILFTIENSSISSTKKIYLTGAFYDICFDGSYLRTLSSTDISVYKMVGDNFSYLTQLPLVGGSPQSTFTKRIIAELGNGDLFMMTKGSSNTTAQMNLVQLGSIKAVPSKTTIAGLTKTALTTSTAGDVYLLPLGTV